MTFSPLEQFQILTIIPFKFGEFNLAFTNSSLFMVIACTFATLLVFFGTERATIVPHRWQSLVEMIYEFILDLVNENVGEKGKKYFPFVFTIFLFVLFCNIQGMVPYSFTVTSHIIITFALSFAIFLGRTVIGFQHHGIHYFSILFPQGAPLGLAPLIVGIEFVSYFATVFSLAIRLFANMMAGHTLLKIIASFSQAMFTMNGVIFFAGFLPIILLIALTGLELAIAFIQAYVFTVLTCVYLNDSINLH